MWMTGTYLDQVNQTYELVIAVRYNPWTWQPFLILMILQYVISCLTSWLGGNKWEVKLKHVTLICDLAHSPFIDMVNISCYFMFMHWLVNEVQFIFNLSLETLPDLHGVWFSSLSHGTMISSWLLLHVNNGHSEYVLSSNNLWSKHIKMWLFLHISLTTYSKFKNKGKRLVPSRLLLQEPPWFASSILMQEWHILLTNILGAWSHMPSSTSFPQSIFVETCFLEMKT